MEKDIQSTFSSLKTSKSIEVRGNGLFALEDIEPWTIILSIRKNDVICCSNISQEFKYRLEYLREGKFVSSSTQIQREILFDSEILMLYLIFLKNTEKSEFYQQWFSRPLTAMYFFNRQAIEETQNIDLLINYVAEHNHLEELCQFIYKSFKKEDMSWLLNREETTFAEFKACYEWSYFFVNNRSFGYTNQFSLIPTFDMINHSSRNSNVTQMLSDLELPSVEELKDIAEKEEQGDDSSDNQDEQKSSSNPDQKQLILKLKNFYYHIFALDKIMKTEQIQIQYGQRNNKFLLQGYGFVEQHNFYDSLQIYVDSTSDSIHYDSVHGQHCSDFTLKRNRFNFDLFLFLKKKYYSYFYNKDASKVKIIWSKPNDKKFQQYSLKSIINQMERQQPKKHIFTTKYQGHYELSVYEHERQSIFIRQIQYYQILLEKLMRNVQEQSGNQETILPGNLVEYYNYLSAL